MSIASPNPASFFAGQWSQIKDALIAAAGFGGNTSGSYNGNNTMTINQMPSHEHKVARWNAENSSYENLDFQSSNVDSGYGWLLLSGAGGTSRTAWATKAGGATLLPLQLLRKRLASQLLNFMNEVL